MPRSCAAGAEGTINALAQEGSRSAVTKFAADEIAEALGAVAQIFQRASIDKICQQDAVAGLYFGPNPVGRVPCVGVDCKRVAGIGGKAHLLVLRERAVGKPAVKDGTDVLD